MFASSYLALLLLGSSMSPIIAQDSCSTTWKCQPTTSPPVLDGNHSEWMDVEAYTTSLTKTTGSNYDAGEATYKCLYDSDNIYFAMEIPGEFRFSADDDHLCAAIATMFKIGENASFVNMGGCPDAFLGCEDGVPETCDAYRVDIGAHWELSGTERGTFYGVKTVTPSGSDNATTTAPGSGNDLIANMDDEYAMSPFCRFDDDDSKAGNEWSGAWDHTNPVEGQFGNYHFEMSRKLTTDSTVTDAQLMAGETIQFGIAFWDPYEEAESGWTDIGHFVTGCGNKWIDLELALLTDETKEESITKTDNLGTNKSSGAEPFFGLVLPLEALALVSFLALFF
jgi:hypothetical protein